MSYDFYMEYPRKPITCPECGGSGEIKAARTHGDLNYTFNISEMFYDAFPGNRGILQLHGLSGSDCLEPLGIAIARMESDPGKYLAMEPPKDAQGRSLGDYKGALDVLRTLRDWCVEHPDAKMRVE